MRERWEKEQRKKVQSQSQAARAMVKDCTTRNLTRQEVSAEREKQDNIDGAEMNGSATRNQNAHS
jgi:hypothetical protein